MRVRLCFGDSKGRAAAIRGQEEGIGDTLAAKIRASLTYYRPPLLSEPGCEVRLHDTTLYTSMFRYDDDLLVNPHVWGRPASANPPSSISAGRTRRVGSTTTLRVSKLFGPQHGPGHPTRRGPSPHGQD